MTIVDTLECLVDKHRKLNIPTSPLTGTCYCFVTFHTNLESRLSAGILANRICLLKALLLLGVGSCKLSQRCGSLV